MNKKLKKTIALSEIFIFLLSSFAFVFLLSMEIGVVDAATPGTDAWYNEQVGNYIKFGDNRYLQITGYDATQSRYNYVDPTSKQTLQLAVRTDNVIISPAEYQKLFPAAVVAPTPDNSAGTQNNVVPTGQNPGPSVTADTVKAGTNGLNNGDIIKIDAPYNYNGVTVPVGIYTYADGKFNTVTTQTTTINGVVQKPHSSPPIDIKGQGQKMINDDALTIIKLDSLKIDTANSKTTGLPTGEYTRLPDGSVGNIVDGKLTPIDTSKLSPDQTKSLNALIKAQSSPSTGTVSDVKKVNYLLGEGTYTQGTLGAFGKNLLEGVAWAGAVLTFTQLVGNFMPGENNKNLIQEAGKAVVLGVLAGKSVYGVFEAFGATNTQQAETIKSGGKVNFFSANRGIISGVVGGLAAYWYFAKNYVKTDTKEETIEFKCMAWQAPSGGSSCDLCNKDPLKPCSEYRCKSLGQTCKLLNAGTGFEKCIDSAPDDVTSPGIKPLESVLTNGYSYTEVKPRPPGGSGPAGMKITYNGGCLPAFTPFKFGIATTDNGKNGVELQPAQCKIEFNHTNSFNDMNYFMSEDNLYIINHTQAISLPGTTLNKEQNTSLQVKNDNEYTMYIRCKDGNGNENRDEFAVKFCIDPTPDLTSPIIKTTSIPSGSAVLYKADNVSLQVYTNEPSNCRWSRKDSSYDNMENKMSCTNNLWEMNAEMFYTCNTILTGIKDKEKNDFYFRCQDMNNNTQQQSYAFTLYGTQPLTILSVGPSGTLGSSTSTATVKLEVKTDNGFSNGASDCYYSTSETNSSFVKMFQTGTNTHSQDLDLVGGSYTYYYKCIDAGGNIASNKTNFEVFVDNFAPAIVRAFQVTDKIYLITDEPSTCKYSTTSCNFNFEKEGIDMPYAESNEHYAELKTEQTYYVKCSDKFGNQPEPTECSMTIKPYKITE